MNEDLKWLAENVHDWPEKYNDLDKLLDSIAESYAGVWNGSEWEKINGFTRAKWQAARDELSGKPKAWPEGVNVLVQNDDGVWVFGTFSGAYCNSNGGWTGIGAGEWLRDQPHHCGKVLGDWRETLERRPQSSSSRKTQEECDSIANAKRDQYFSGKQWRGPEDGLPPVGVEFEFSKNGKCWEERIMLFNDGVTCLMACKKHQASRWHYKCDDHDIICRPLRTEEDNAVDAITEVITNHYENPKGSESYIGLAKELYRAGYRKQETEK